MPRLDYKRCRACGRFSKDVGELSHTRLCLSCGERRYVENIVQMDAHAGPNFLKWRRSMAASVGGVLLDDVLTTH